ncbi:MAG TPA: hypothetical protein DCR40_08590 [Prolixibacteraceae bacterium]|nr:hypothetical protein [Prolixibacteraceae bacterium]
MKAKLQITLILSLMASLLFGQQKFADKLILRDGTIINCEVREIGDDEIKYSVEGIRSDILIGIDKNKVATILFADGREMTIKDSMNNSEEYNKQRKNAIKVNVFLPVSGAFELGYERSLKPGRSFESSIGIIYSGNNQETSMDASGIFLKAGYKFIKDPDFYLKGMRYAHILKGSYIKPELAFATFSYDKSNLSSQLSTPEKPSGSVTKLAVLLNVGKQVVFDNRFVFDWFIGAGYVLGGGVESFRYFAFTGTGGSSFTMSGGVKIGLLF